MSITPPNVLITDEELMYGYADGNDDAFRLLFDRYAPILLRLTRRHLRDETLAEEIVQQTFVRLHCARNGFRPGSKLRPWIMTIVMNLVRERWRRDKRRRIATLQGDTKAAPEAEFTPFEILERSELLHAALDGLPGAQREVVELRWFQERPYSEVAAIIGTSEAAVRVRAHRARRTLERLLMVDIGDDSQTQFAAEQARRRRRSPEGSVRNNPPDEL